MATSESIVVPFTVLVDTAEDHPFSLTGMKGDASQQYRPLVVITRYCNLGRYPNSLGDYSIEGMVGQCHVERKSVDDCIGTVLGWDSALQVEKGRHGRRNRFEKELDNLSKIDCAAVIVEGSIGTCLDSIPEYGSKSKITNQKIFHRSVIGYQQDYAVPWFFCDSRRLAEITCFRFLYRYWKRNNDADN